MNVEVCYAAEEQQILLTVSMPEGSTVIKAILASGILDQLPDVELEGNVGIFSKKVKLDQVLQAGDRVEIYRKLHLTPNQLRLQRLKKK